jgi:hypothetical protein
MADSTPVVEGAMKLPAELSSAAIRTLLVVATVPLVSTEKE